MEQGGLIVNPISYTSHANKRIAQRGIQPDYIKDTVYYGDKIYSHGIIAFVMTDKALRKNIQFLHNPEKTRGVTVITNQSDSQISIVTAYKNIGSFKKIKKEA